MEPPEARAVVLVRFPFSDLSGSKFRPALTCEPSAAVRRRQNTRCN